MSSFNLVKNGKYQVKFVENLEGKNVETQFAESEAISRNRKCEI